MQVLGGGVCLEYRSQMQTGKLCYGTYCQKNDCRYTFHLVSLPYEFGKAGISTLVWGAARQGFICLATMNIV